MGLTVSHDCFNAAYGAFSRWRKMLAHAAGLPPLELMEGLFEKENHNPLWVQHQWDKERGYDHNCSIWSRLPISWDCLKPSPLHELLHHSDCEGEIEWEKCYELAVTLEQLMPFIPEEEGGGHLGTWRETTQQFANGLYDAHSKQENITFA